MPRRPTESQLSFENFFDELLELHLPSSSRPTTKRQHLQQEAVMTRPSKRRTVDRIPPSDSEEDSQEIICTDSPPKPAAEQLEDPESEEFPESQPPEYPSTVSPTPEPPSTPSTIIDPNITENKENEPPSSIIVLPKSSQNVPASSITVLPKSSQIFAVSSSNASVQTIGDTELEPPTGDLDVVDMPCLASEVTYELPEDMLPPSANVHVDDFTYERIEDYPLGRSERLCGTRLGNKFPLLTDMTAIRARLGLFSVGLFQAFSNEVQACYRFFGLLDWLLASPDSDDEEKVDQDIYSVVTQIWRSRFLPRRIRSILEKETALDGRLWTRRGRFIYHALWSLAADVYETVRASQLLSEQEVKEFDEKFPDWAHAC
ncbi:hypothetical protein BJ508DRAFT_314407 [Ascobolus immersus RN42]|uniref:Uncharacterized protein n=1 Tax=Ascobolus immersus RN42 TaxID=1160509 RepID=A0A3N4HIM3_ASCIM|nr:hypothetical protein BJ508DRAFT_314407 [Ascobolus immersus RN42]